MNTFSKKSDIELQKTLMEKKSSLRELRFAFSGSKARNVKEGQNLRREIARVLTEINKRSQDKKEIKS